MKPLTFILRKSLKNTLRQMKRKPLVLVAYSFLALMMVLMLLVTFVMPSNALRRGSPESFSAIVCAALVVFMYFGIKQGINSGSSFFRLSDVNLVFTAPISPKKILIYGFIQQLFISLFIILFLSFQIPNLKNNFPIYGWGVLIIYICVFFLFFAMQLISMLIYSIATKAKAIRANLEKGLNVLVVLFSGGFLFMLLEKKDFMKAAVQYLNLDFFDYIPFLGWFKVVLTSAVLGITPGFYINLLLIVLSFLVMIYAIYKLKTDYYEDVLAATERKEQLLAAKREGKSAFHLRNIKLKKVQQKYGSSGGMAIFYRHLLEYKKSGFFFLNRTTLLMVVVGIASKYFFSNVLNAPGTHNGVSSPSDPGFEFKLILYSTIYILFFLSIQGKWAMELGKSFIFLIPAKSSTKLFYSTLAENLKNGVDGLILFSVAGFMFKASVPVILLSAIAYMTFGVIFTYGDVLSRRLFGGVHSKHLEMFFKMFLTLFIIVPGIIVSAIFLFIFKDSGLVDYIFYITLIGYNVLASSLILLSSKGIFDHLEMK